MYQRLYFCWARTDPKVYKAMTERGLGAVAETIHLYQRPSRQPTYLCIPKGIFRIRPCQACWVFVWIPKHNNSHQFSIHHHYHHNMVKATHATRSLVVAPKVHRTEQSALTRISIVYGRRASTKSFRVSLVSRDKRHRKRWKNWVGGRRERFYVNGLFHLYLICFTFYDKYISYRAVNSKLNLFYYIPNK